MSRIKDLSGTQVSAPGFHPLEWRWGIRVKLLLAYGIFALLPMLIITFYTYQSTRDILIEQLTEQINRKLDQDVKNIDEKALRLFNVTNILYTDALLYNYLTIDYSEKGYEDLYYYVKTQFSRIKMMYPEIEQLSIYSNNATLPQDMLYLFCLSEEEVTKWGKFSGKNGNEFQAHNLEDGMITFIRRLNLYESADFQLFLRMDIRSSQLSEMVDSSGGVSYLQDLQGNVLFYSEPAGFQGHGGETGNPGPEDGKLPIEEGIRESDDGWISISKETQYCGILTNSENMGALQKQAGRTSSKVFMVFFAASIMAAAAIYIFSSYFKRGVDRIIAGAREIGGGNLEYRIQVTSSDELGQVSEEINQLGGKLDTLIEESFRKEISRKESEMNLLQEQINPHFLYNALSSISSMARRKQDMDTCNAILSLADFYRISLNKGNKIFTVKDEIKLLESYLKIQKMRFGDIICVEYDLDRELMDREIIKLILQPVVENAIHHGRYNDQEEFHIRIKLFRHGGRMIFTVSDDGVGMEADKLMLLQGSMEQSQNGMGLRNVNSRIKLQYGGEYGVFLESQPFLGTIIRLELPLSGNE